MKILIYSNKNFEQNGTGWFRDGENIQYFSNQILKGTGTKTYFTLTFSYHFRFTDDTVYFAYSHPYTYSDL